MSELHELTIAGAGALVQSRQLSSLELTQHCLTRIRRLDSRLNSFITVCEDAATASALRADAEVAAGRYRGPLHGIPIGLKDLFATRGVRTTCASQLRQNHLPAEDAEVVRLLRQTGAVIIGKLNMHEFAYGATGESELSGPSRNPWDTSRSTGGSSGGSAAAVAAGFCLGALGTDTGGSIRIPAALCGVVGFKPTSGRVSCAGVETLSWTLDHVGPLAASSHDVALILQAIAPADREAGDGAARFEAASLRGARIGVPREQFWEPVERDVGQRLSEAQEVLRSLGAVLEPVSIPEMAWSRAVQVILQSAEATAHHRRWMESRGDEYGADVRVRLAQGLFVPATDYVQACRARSVLKRAMAAALQQHDVLLTPTCVLGAAEVGAREVSVGGQQDLTVTWLTRCTYPFNLTGFPAVSTPCGVTEEGLPVGLQLVGRPSEDLRVLGLAAAYEEAAGLNRMRPSL